MAVQTFAIELAPLVKEEIETALTVPGPKRDPAAAKELLQAVRSPGTRLKLSVPAVKLLLSEVRMALKILDDPYLSKEDSLAYHKMAMKKAFEHLAPLGLLVASQALPAGPLSARLLRASLLLTAGMCPKDGCVVKRKGAWRVVSNKTGKLWPQTYTTKKDAQDAIAAYHIGRRSADA
jgi:hypothetical protein